MRPRISLRLVLPFAVAFTAIFGANYVIWGIVALRRGNVPFAIFYALYGFGGIVLAISLARVWRQLRRSAAGATTGGTSGSGTTS
jgi:hypothetical protein